jgi:hypothetical protein
VYFGKNSTRWALKLYYKGDELLARRKGHRLPDVLPERARLLQWAEGVVRFELTLRSKELEKIDVAHWDPLKVWQHYYDKITWNQNARMAEADMLEVRLSTTQQATLVLWRQGVDLRARMTKPTFYRVRQVLLKEVGVDIASPPPKVPAATDAPTAVLAAEGWDPEPLEGYTWTPADRDRLL